MDNLALNRPALQSSTSTWSTNPKPEIDARVANNGDLMSPAFFHTALESNPWWQVDLEDEFLIERIVLYNRLDIKSRLKHFSVLRSHDGKEWFEFFRKTDDEVFALYPVSVSEPCLARYVRIRLNGEGVLHFRECQVYGRRAAPAVQARVLAEDERLAQERNAPPEGRRGHFTQIGGFSVFVDQDRYSETIRKSLTEGHYEGRERKLVGEFLRPDDRVLEVGTAIGVVSMTAASIVGATNVATFDANPAIVSDAQENFRRNGLQAIASHVGILACRRKFIENRTAEFYISKDFWASRLNATPTSHDIVRSETVPIRCLEREIAAHEANVLICDIEGGEVQLLTGADLSGIRLIILETHYWAAGEAPTDAMIRDLIMQGFALHLGASGSHVLVLRRS
jgi:FkbM family methyltransferase